MPDATQAQSGWGLDYDADVFVPLPSAAALSSDPAAAARWIQEVIDHQARGRELTSGDVEALRLTAQAMLDQVEPYVTRLYFSPPGAYSDVLVTVVVAEPGSATADQLVADVAAQGSVTGAEMTTVTTDRHGVGVLIRRTSAVPGESRDDALLVAHWNLLLQGEHDLIAVDATGSTIEVFAELDPRLLTLVDGIQLPGMQEES